MSKPVKVNGQWDHKFTYNKDPQYPMQYVTDDGHWIWERSTGEKGDWYPNPSNPEPQDWVASVFNTNQTAAQPAAPERIENSMLWNIAVTTKAVSNANNNGIVKPEEILVPQTQVMALDERGACLALGVEHASQLKDTDLTNVVVHIRQGV